MSTAFYFYFYFFKINFFKKNIVLGVISLERCLSVFFVINLSF